jgi:hypothetical protein
MILEALKSFGPKKPTKADKGKKGGRPTRAVNDSKSKETVGSKPRDKRSPISARKTPVLSTRGKTPQNKQMANNEKRSSVHHGGVSEGEQMTDDEDSGSRLSNYKKRPAHLMDPSEGLKLHKEAQ